MTSSICFEAEGCTYVCVWCSVFTYIGVDSLAGGRLKLLILLHVNHTITYRTCRYNRFHEDETSALRRVENIINIRILIYKTCILWVNIA
jgi:hypothetical protein